MHKQQVELGWLKRPARRQVDESTIKKEERRDGGTHNVWSGRSLDRPVGPDRGRDKKERSKYRCRPELDVGRTRGSDAKQMMFCLYFSKGCCAQGSACVYLHRLPTEEDEAYHKKDMAADIFGREKRAEHEGYRKGAGTFERDNRTIYVNYEGAGSYDLPKVRQLMEDNFNMWGPIKRIYIVHNKTLAFVEYEWRSSAEFAKEAMHKQGLKGSTQAEVLSLRWANEDPNPTSVLAVKRSHMDAFEKAAMSSWEALPEEQKQARILQLQMSHSLQKGRVISDYPSTDAQYMDPAEQYPSTDEQYPSTDEQYPDTDAQYGAGTTVQYENMTEEQYANYCADYYAYYGQPAGGADVAAGLASEQGGSHDGGKDNALGLLAGYGSSSSDDDEPQQPGPQQGDAQQVQQGEGQQVQQGEAQQVQQREAQQVLQGEAQQVQQQQEPTRQADENATLETC